MPVYARAVLVPPSVTSKADAALATASYAENKNKARRRDAVVDCWTSAIRFH
jgi:hypothetical protein